MGFVDFIKSIKIYEWMNFIFFIISLVMLIVGSVAIGILYADMPPMPPYPDDIPSTVSTPVSAPFVIVTVSLATGVAWSNDLSNSSSDAFKILSGSLEKNISTAWAVPQPHLNVNDRGEFLAVLPPLTTQINAFTKGTDGVNFYSQFVFSDASATTASVENSLFAIGYMTNAYAQSTSLCEAVLPPVNGNQKFEFISGQAKIRKT